MIPPSTTHTSSGVCNCSVLTLKFTKITINLIIKELCEGDPLRAVVLFKSRWCCMDARKDASWNNTTRNQVQNILSGRD